jgi:aryl-alcohol dehydrogenase-like predicted oxidoreductase
MNGEENKTECRLVLGTVQLGIPYGISNRSGQPDISSAIAIVETAWRGGIHQFDTAQGYGDSEKVLGKALYDVGVSNQAKIISKLDPSIDYTDNESVKRSIYQSLNNLKISCLHGLLLHREEIIDYFNEGIIDTLNKFVNQGVIKNIGISVYSPHRAIQAMKYETIKLIQLPANVLDNRFWKYGVFDFAEQNNKIVYIRSIFLQGLILLDASELPEKMKFAQGVIEDLDVFCHKNGISRKALAISYIKYKYPKSYVLFGAEAIKQVEDNIVNWEHKIGKELMNMIDERYCNVEEAIINPLLWKN